jgi:hypothetical protein
MLPIVSNLYRLEASAADLARQFGVDPTPELSVPSPAQPRKQGLIMRGTSGNRSMHVLHWVFRGRAAPSSPRAGVPLPRRMGDVAQRVFRRPAGVPSAIVPGRTHRDERTPELWVKKKKASS